MIEMTADEAITLAKKNAEIYSVRFVDKVWGVSLGIDGKIDVSYLGSSLGCCFIAAIALGQPFLSCPPNLEYDQIIRKIAGKVTGWGADKVSGCVFGFDGSEERNYHDAQIIHGITIGKQARNELLVR